MPSTLYRCKHKHSPTILYSYGKSISDVHTDLVEIIYTRPKTLSNAFVKARYSHLIAVGVLAPPARPVVDLEQWDISVIAHNVPRNGYLSIIQEFQDLAVPNVFILNAPKRTR